jgi:ketosteroid isomerase-like protein
MKSERMDVSHLDRTINEYHAAVNDLVKGNAGPIKKVYSQRDDASLANPFGPVARGWREVARAIDKAAAYFHDGTAAEFERVSAFACSDLAYIVEAEELRARLGAGMEVEPFTLRVTTVLRREDGVWKVVHRHADPITRDRLPGSVVPEDEKSPKTRKDGVTI